MSIAVYQWAFTSMDVLGSIGQREIVSYSSRFFPLMQVRGRLSPGTGARSLNLVLGLSVQRCPEALSFLSPCIYRDHHLILFDLECDQMNP